MFVFENNFLFNFYLNKNQESESTMAAFYNCCLIEKKQPLSGSLKTIQCNGFSVPACSVKAAVFNRSLRWW